MRERNINMDKVSMEPVYHKKTFENIAPEKRHKILEVAIGEFANHGFDNANINVIAQKAHVSVGSLYKYFDTKQDLFLTAVHYGVQILEGTLLDVADSDCDIVEKLDSVIAAIQHSSREYGDLIKLYNEMTSENNIDLVKSIARDMETVSARVYTNVLEDAQKNGELQENVDPKMFAYFLDNLFMNLQFSYACGYYQERFKIYAGEDIAERDDYVRSQMIAFVKGAFEGNK